ncbi:MAG TPA: hypothetical protein VN578_10665 [Candidatus Binatia bacterium]|jgi:hypothetical protein|nr:hypothetical protein [Candidatus Binatia bacterium]
MSASREQKSSWLLFCVPAFLRGRARLVFSSEELTFEATVKLKFLSADSIRCEGDLFGSKFKLEARSRRRLPGDVKDAIRIQFAGRFEHEEGASGDFTIRQQRDGELMRLGVYGTSPLLRVVKLEPSAVVSPLDVEGFRDARIRLERWHRAITPPAVFPAKPAKRFYVGRCVTEKGCQDGIVPMASVLSTLMLVYELVLLPKYMSTD